MPRNATSTKGTRLIYAIDLNPGSKNFHEVAHSIGGFDAPAEGRINSLAVNANGTRLFAAVPATMLNGGTRSFKDFGADPGKIIVVNVDEEDRPKPGEKNSRKWREVIGELDGGVEPYEIRATLDPDRLLFVARLGDSQGLRTIEITNPNPTHFAAQVTTISLQRNANPIGVKIGFYGAVTGTYSQHSDLNIRNAGQRRGDPGSSSTPSWAITGSPPSLRTAAWLADEIEARHELGLKDRDREILRSAPRLRARRRQSPRPSWRTYDSTRRARSSTHTSARQAASRSTTPY